MTTDVFKDTETIVKGTPFLSTIQDAIKVYKWILHPNEKSDLEKAVEVLREQVEIMRADIENMNSRLNDHSRRIMQLENVRRLDLIRHVHYPAVADLAFKLQLTPDKDELAAIANRATLTIDGMVDDEDLWLWTDVAVGRTPGGAEELRPLDPEFKVVPLGLLAMAVGVLVLAAARHIAIEVSARDTYRDAFAKYRGALSIRPDWDGKSPGVTLPEKVRGRIVGVLLPQNKYAAKGRCEFGLRCDNYIERTSTFIRGDLVVYLADPDAMCTAPANLGLADELAFEDAYGPIELMELLRDSLDRMHERGTLSLPEPPPSFADEQAVSAYLYAVRPNGDMVRYSCPMTNYLRTADGRPISWQTSNNVVGTGWQGFGTVSAVGWNHIYAVTEDGSIRWYQHDGARKDVFGWTGPVEVSPPVIHKFVRVVDMFTDGVHAGIFQVIRGPAHKINGLVPSLQFLPHSQQGLEKSRTILQELPDHRLGFGGGANSGAAVFYTLTHDGQLFWNSWTLNPFKVLEPRLVGTGFGAYATMFSTGEGMIYGVHPNGTMEVHFLENWRDPYNSPIDMLRRRKIKGRWSGPVSVPGLNWNAFARLVPTYGGDPGGVK